jgi:hypothetical protein
VKEADLVLRPEIDGRSIATIHVKGFLWNGPGDSINKATKETEGNGQPFTFLYAPTGNKYAVSGLRA